MENSENLKIQLLKEREEFEREKIAWNNIQMERANDLRKKIDDLLKIQNDLNNYEDIPSYKYKNGEEINKLKIEIENIKNTYNSKLSEFEQTKNSLLKEKSNFEFEINKKRSELKQKQNMLDREKKNIFIKENEYNKKFLDLEIKEKDLNNNLKDIEKIERIILEKMNKNLKDKKDLENAEYKKNKFYNELLKEEIQMQEKQNGLNQLIDELEKDKMEIINDKKEIEELEKEKKIRMGCIDSLLSNQNIFKQFDIIENIFIKNKNNEIKKGDIELENGAKDINGDDNYIKNKNNDYNTEMHLLKIKNRIDLNKIKLDNKYNMMNKFDPIKEQRYLQKSYESLKRIKKE